MQRGTALVLDSYGCTNFKFGNFRTVCNNQDYCSIMHDSRIFPLFSEIQKFLITPSIATVCDIAQLCYNEFVLCEISSIASKILWCELI